MLEARVLVDRFRGAMLGAAIGDAIGHHAQSGSSPLLPTVLDDNVSIDLTYTSATELSIAVAESLIERQAFSGMHLASSLVTHYLAAPDRGYGLPLTKVLDLLAQDVGWNQAGHRLYRGLGSYSCEPALRIVPVALFAFRQPSELKRIAGDVALVTHHNELAVEGATLMGSALGLVLERDSRLPLNRLHLLDTIRFAARQEAFHGTLKHLPYLIQDSSVTEARELIGTSDAAHEAVPAALYVFLTNLTSFTNTLASAIRFGNAPGATGTLAGALAGAHLGASAIPATWSKYIEGGQQLLNLADALLTMTISDVQNGQVADDFIVSIRNRE